MLCQEQIGLDVGTHCAELDTAGFWLWLGSFSEIFWKDVDAANLYGVDVDPGVIAVCRETGVPGTFGVVESYGRLPFPDAFFSHVVAYSVFTHLPQKVHLHWMKEIARVAKPGASFCLTLEPRRFLDFVSRLDERTAETGWEKGMSRFAALASSSKQAFDSGEFIYLPTGGGKYRESEVYGEAIVPLHYIERNWKGFFAPSNMSTTPPGFRRRRWRSSGSLELIESCASSARERSAG